MSRVHDIAKLIASTGVTITEVTESDDPTVEDNEILLTDGYHVQVGEDYLALGKQSGDCFEYQPSRKDLTELCDDLASTPIATARLRKMCGRCTCVEDPDEPCALHGMRRTK